MKNRKYKFGDYVVYTGDKGSGLVDEFVGIKLKVVDIRYGLVKCYWVKPEGYTSGYAFEEELRPWTDLEEALE